tara:strand:- start:270 stop:509 length:240 start_codon:yes stop_codon:yes gene_type:complete
MININLSFFIGLSKIQLVSNIKMIALIRPLLFKFVNTPQVKQLIIDLLTKLADSTDNTVDDKAVVFIKNGLFPGAKTSK